jgi:hypothetical protein
MTLLRWAFWFGCFLTFKTTSLDASTNMTPGILKQRSDGDVVATGGGSTNEIVWGIITVFEFPNILGDNPAVSEGAPLTIDWKHNSRRTVGVEYYEFERIQRPRRSRKRLIMKSCARDT